ncbi:unnamed protein product [Cylindrotheca closterium]|uniref:Ubiquitin-like domain-containing protein n=1 Tax=Cylindrotheca closterium TaxID=2856 RepID=A0AAD2FKZ0_9STRA|nr:unnamed protein product [Cylindrotheca closterium]
MTSSDPWSISVKAVGIGFNSEEEATAASSSRNANGERQFIVEVSPEDGVASLHDKIEGATGLKASQQRLIYRGRLIGKFEQRDENEEPRIKDIAGLCDGQTIHLVKKRDQSEESNNESNAGNTNGSSSDPTDFLGNASSSGGGGSLLAALLGLGNLPEEISNEDRDSSGISIGGGSSNTPTAAMPTTAASPSNPGTRGPRWGWRSSRIGRPRRPHYRLTAEDLQVNDPGSMEPVRQGLMTLHTLLPHAQQVHSDQVSTPLEANREWFRGQWIDCRDTVNQWLEATVVEIMSPDDILPPRDEDSLTSSVSRRGALPRHQRLPHVANDPAVGAADLQGRRRLLLEPCDSNDSDAEEGSLAGSRRRSNNEGVQMLLIHYNGWPHRWDEWIRSDSERIRPFRTRTRHPNVSSTASPTPQSVFNDAPSTNIRSEEEDEDRVHLLPELARAVSAINDLLNQVAASETSRARPGEGHDDLPWVPAEPQNSSSSPNYNRRQLQNLAPLLDRLGRTLTDAAPHLAALADSLPSTRTTVEGNQTESSETNDDGSIPDSLPDLNMNLSRNSGDGDHHPPTTGGLLSLWNRERRSQNSMHPDEVRSGLLTDEDIDPDYVDYATGVVNTSRGDVRAGPRSRPQNDDVASLLGAYLAAASLSNAVGGDDNGNEEGGGGMGGAAQSLGSILRERGNGGGGGSGGIDIHIHAVVTTPGGGGGGGGGGGLGLAALGGGGPIPTATVIGSGNGGGVGGNTGLGGTGRTLFASRDRGSRTSSILRSRHSHTAPAVPASEEIEDTSLFSELYSENPEPVDPNGSPEPDARRASRPPIVDDDDTDFIRRIAAMNEGDDRDNAGTNTRRSRNSFRRQSTERRGWGRLFRRRRSHRDSNL